MGVAGDTGILSVKNAVEALSDQTDGDRVVILQESTRPLVREELISRLLMACREYGSTVTYQRMDDHVQFYEEGGKIQYIDRYRILSAQSPEVYRLSQLQQVFDAAAQANHTMDETCLAMLFYKLGYPIHFCEGSRNNIKIIRQEDLAIFRALLTESV